MACPRALQFLVVCLLDFPGTWGAASSVVWRGISPGPLPNTDTAPHLTIAGLRLCSAVAGSVRAVELFLDPGAKAERSVQPAESVGAPIWLQVWRPGLRRRDHTPNPAQPPWRLVAQVSRTIKPQDLGGLLQIDLADQALPVAVGDCFGWYTGAWNGLVPFESIDSSTMGLEAGLEGVVWAFGHRLAHLGGSEVSLGMGWAARRYALRILFGPLLDASPALN
ncbi:unnamed protein product, partial [Polarella glacialis]